MVATFLVNVAYILVGYFVNCSNGQCVSSVNDGVSTYNSARNDRPSSFGPRDRSNSESLAVVIGNTRRSFGAAG